MTRLLECHLWMSVKPLVQNHASEDAALIFDDTMFSKSYTDENTINCWRWNQSENRAVKGFAL